MKLYLSAPMSGRPKFGIPEIDAAAKVLRKEGHEVVSPAELDDPWLRYACLKTNGKPEELSKFCHQHRIPSWGELLARDIKLIADDGIEAIVVLPGWTLSRGALLETYVGRLCGLPILYYPDLKQATEMVLEDVHGRAVNTAQREFQRWREHVYSITKQEGESRPRYVAKPEGIFEMDVGLCGPPSQPPSWQMPEGPIKRALPLVHGDRQATYGHPADDFSRTAGMWKAMFGWDVDPKDVPLAMIAVKLSRLRQSPDHTDSVTDICGYAETYEMCKERA